MYGTLGEGLDDFLAKVEQGAAVIGDVKAGRKQILIAPNIPGPQIVWSDNTGVVGAIPLLPVAAAIVILFLVMRKR
jgi:hypothetical protein